MQKKPTVKLLNKDDQTPMNASLTPSEEDTYGTDIFSVLGEPEDPNSGWNELRITQLSGYDYLFLSRRLNTKLASRSNLNEFVLDLYQVMETNNERAKIFIYSDDGGGRPEFAAMDVNYHNGELRDFHISPIKNLEQKEFIRTIFEHSGMSVGLA